MSLRVTLIQGGGAGWDQVKSVKRIIKEAGVEIDWDEHFAGRAAVEMNRPALPPAMLGSVRETGLALKTKLFPPVDAPTEASGRAYNYNVILRKELDLFATVRPLKNLGGLKARFSDVDLLVIRELTQDLYAAIEHEIVPGVVQSLKVVTKEASDRFFRFAFEWARSEGRKKAHCVHKANILKLADGLFLESFRETAKDFPEIETHEIIVDNCSMQMVSRPHQFDVMMMGNLYGDIVSDLAAGVVGGISATAGINVGEVGRVYEAVHGATHVQVGEDLANPLPLLVPALELLRHHEHAEAAERILGATESVLRDGSALTHDLGGRATTTEMTNAIVAAL